ncbi:hypothetical protein PS15m_004698 [Mucor circinelloides]
MGPASMMKESINTNPYLSLFFFPLTLFIQLTHSLLVIQESTKRWPFSIINTFIHIYRTFTTNKYLKMKTSFSTAVTAMIAAFLMTAQAAPAASSLQARSSMSGDATYYSVGLGSCGDTNSDGEMVAALSEKLMGTGSDGSYCGKSITLKSKGGKSVTVKVVDSCPGCGEGDVDLSPTAFKKLGALSEGVIPITWSL